MFKNSSGRITPHVSLAFPQHSVGLFYQVKLLAKQINDVSS